LFASGYTTGIALDSGEGISTITAVYEGYQLPHMTQKVYLSGNIVAQHLVKLLNEKEHSFHSVHDFVIQDIKEKYCYVALDYDEEISEQSSKPLVLPDGKEITLGNELFRCTEVLFKPFLVGSEEPGIAEAISRSILKSDTDIRKTLCESIVLAGGNTMFPNLETRLSQELKPLLAPYNTNIIANPYRRYR
jgi:actin-related protein